MAQKKSKENQIEQEENYVEFLRKRLGSDNFKANVTKEEYELTKKKLNKALEKLKLFKRIF